MCLPSGIEQIGQVDDAPFVPALRPCGGVERTSGGTLEPLPSDVAARGVRHISIGHRQHHPARLREIHRGSGGIRFRLILLEFPVSSSQWDREDDTDTAFNARTLAKGPDAQLWVRTPDSDKERSATLEAAAGLVADAGFDEFIRRQWQPLLAGETVPLEFAVPSRLDSYGFTVRRRGSGEAAGEGAEIFRLRLGGLFGLLTPFALLCGLSFVATVCRVGAPDEPAGVGHRNAGAGGAPVSGAGVLPATLSRRVSRAGIAGGGDADHPGTGFCRTGCGIGCGFQLPDLSANRMPGAA